MADFDVTFRVRVHDVDAESEEYMRDDTYDFVDVNDLFGDGEWQIERV